MLRNLKIEWLKIRNYRTFWVLVILFVLCTIGVNYIVYQFKADATTPAPISMMLGNPFQFPDVWQTVTYFSSFLLFVPGLILLIFTTNEFNYRTNRQNIIDGISRFDFAFTKVLMAVIFSVIVTIFVALIALTVGLIGGGVSFIGDKLYFIFYFLLQAFTYSIVGVLLGFLIKRSGLAIALYFIYLVFIKNIVAAIFIHFVYNSGYYFPVKSSDSLIPFPFFKALTKEMMTPPNVSVLLITTLIYIVAFYFIIIKKYKTDDL